MKQTRLTIKNEYEETLVCIEARPDQSDIKKLPAVILCHGFHWQKEESGLFVGIAERLVAESYIVYYFDFSGCGESEGDYAETSLTKLVQDLKKVYDTVINFAYIDKTNISLVGQSFGTNVVIASQLLNVKKIVLCGSFYDPLTLLSGLMDTFDYQGISSRHRSNGKDTIIKPQFWSDLKKYQLPELMTNYICPILFIHGGKDTTVPITNMLPLKKAALHAVDPVILDKSDHGLRPQRAKVFQAVAEFMLP